MSSTIYSRILLTSEKSIIRDAFSKSLKTGSIVITILAATLFLNAALLLLAMPVMAEEANEANRQSSNAADSSQSENPALLSSDNEVTVTDDVLDEDADPDHDPAVTETESANAQAPETTPEQSEPEPTRQPESAETSTQTADTTADSFREAEQSEEGSETTSAAATEQIVETSDLEDDSQSANNNSPTASEQPAQTQAADTDTDENRQHDVPDETSESESNTAISADSENNLKVIDIIIIEEPSKQVYEPGDDLDLDGLIVHRIFENEAQEPLDTEDLLISGFDSSIAGSIQEVMVSYDDFSAVFTVTVEQEGRGLIGWVIDNAFISMLIILLLIMLVSLLSRRLKQSQAYEPPPSQERIGKSNIIGEKISFDSKLRQGHSESLSHSANGIRNKRMEPAKNSRQNVSKNSMNKKMNDNPMNNTKPRKSKKKRLLIIPIALLVLLLLGYGGLLNLLSGMQRERIPQDDQSLGIDQASSDPRITNIAVFGIDSVDGMTGRSDAIMILTLDEKHDKIKITSIVRDSYVDIPGRGLDKINHAYAFGGPELAIKTINQNFRLDVRHYISLNFSSMPAIINAIDGVEIKITDQEATQISGVSSSGTYTLNGDQALQFSRIRKIDSDFERSRRQRDVMEATIKAAFDKPVTSYPSMMNQIFPHMKTNLSSNQMLNMGRKTVMNNIRTIEQVQFPPAFLGSGQTINGIYYYVFDREKGAEMLSRYIFHDELITENSQI